MLKLNCRGQSSILNDCHYILAQQYIQVYLRDLWKAKVRLCFNLYQREFKHYLMTCLPYMHVYVTDKIMSYKGVPIIKHLPLSVGLTLMKWG